MGAVLQLRPEPVDPRHAGWVQTLCLFAGVPGRAADYLFRKTSRSRIVAELWVEFYGRRSPEGSAAYVAHIRGPHGPARRSLPIFPGQHGVRRRPA